MFIRKPIINNAALISYPQLSQTNWTSLQRFWTLRTIAGCHMLTQEKHLHEETAILPVQSHSVMLSKLFAQIICLSTSVIDKYRYTITELPPPDSTNTLNSGIEILHTTAVQATAQTQQTTGSNITQENAYYTGSITFGLLPKQNTVSDDVNQRVPL